MSQQPEHVKARLDPYRDEKCLGCPNLGSGEPCPHSRMVRAGRGWVRFTCAERGETWKLS